jgi:fructose-1,6-bisphosphatase class II
MLEQWLFDILKVTENAAIACYDWIGKGDEIAADNAAVYVMRKELNALAISGRIVIGEGERDEAPMLYIDEKVGSSGDNIDIAVDPLEGTSICAKAGGGAMSVMAFSANGGFLNAPDIYMQKIAVGPGLPKNIIDINLSVKENLLNLALFRKCRCEELTLMTLNRERHQFMIEEVRSLGAKVKLISDGDIYAVIAAADHNNEVDMYAGIGGAPEGVLAAAALKCIGGQMQTKLLFKNNDTEQINRAKKMGISNPNKIYTVDDLAKSDVIFSATGVTDGLLLNGVKKSYGKFSTETLLMSSSQKKVFKIATSRH